MGSCPEGDVNNVIQKPFREETGIKGQAFLFFWSRVMKFGTLIWKRTECLNTNFH